MNDKQRKACVGEIDNLFCDWSFNETQGKKTPRGNARYEAIEAIIAAHDKQPSGDFGEPWTFCGHDPNDKSGDFIKKFESGTLSEKTHHSESDIPCSCGYIFGFGGEAYIAKVITSEDDVDPYPNKELHPKIVSRIVACVNALANRDTGAVDARIKKLEKLLERSQAYIVASDVLGGPKFFAEIAEAIKGVE